MIKQARNECFQNAPSDVLPQEKRSVTHATNCIVLITIPEKPEHLRRPKPENSIVHTTPIQELEDFYLPVLPKPTSFVIANNKSELVAKNKSEPVAKNKSDLVTKNKREKTLTMKKTGDIRDNRASAGYADSAEGNVIDCASTRPALTTVNSHKREPEDHLTSTKKMEDLHSGRQSSPIGSISHQKKHSSLHEFFSHSSIRNVSVFEGNSQKRRNDLDLSVKKTLEAATEKSFSNVKDVPGKSYKYIIDTIYKRQRDRKSESDVERVTKGDDSFSAIKDKSRSSSLCSEEPNSRETTEEYSADNSALDDGQLSSPPEPSSYMNQIDESLKSRQKAQERITRLKNRWGFKKTD